MTAVALPPSLQRQPRLDRWLRFDADGGVTAFSGKVELGQGIAVALATLVADELDVPPARVRMQPADTDRSPDEGMTSGSLSVQDSGAALRQACAEARALLLGEAARHWLLDAATLAVVDGAVVAPDGRRAGFGSLAGGGLLAVDACGRARPKPASALRLAGRPAPRPDLDARFAGRANFIHDLELPGLRHARVLRPPRPDAELVETDLPEPPSGVQRLRDGRLFALVGEREPQVDDAAARLAAALRWGPTAPLPDEADLASWLLGAPVQTEVVAEKAGPPVEVARRFEARYLKPFVAHASLAPSCALAQFDGRRLQVWTHSQGIHALKRDLALALKLGQDAIVVRHVAGAGCYGHNGADDAAFDAAWLACRLPGAPLRVRFSRADEMVHAPFGPAMAMRLEADVDAAGRIVGWRHEVTSPGHSGRPGRAPTPALLDSAYVDGGTPLPVSHNVSAASGGGAERNAVPGYDFASWLVVAHRLLAMPIRTSALRSLGAFGNVFAAESFIDEIARALGHDPVDYRLRHLADERARRVVEAAVAASGWRHRARAPHHGIGLGQARYKGTGAWCAVVAEVEAAETIRVHRLTIAADVGFAVDPDGVCAQLEGGAIQAAGWALKEAVRFDRERITSDDWERYPVLRFSEVPEVDVRLIDSDAPSLGAGEAALGPTAAAIANAVADALGVRVRELPLTPERVAAAMG